MIGAPAATGPRRFVRRVALVTVGIAALLAIGFFGWGAVGRYSLADAHPPPGQLVDVGGYRLHIDCVGEGTGPTVILEAGNADFSVMWAKVQPELATSARVCAYDRAGLGWSERSKEPRTLDAMTGDLVRLLDAAGIEGKLLLVGHSFGGIVARSFAVAHPERVAGLVLVDPAHERQLEVSPTMRVAVEAGAAQFDGLVPLASWGLLAMLPGNIPNRGLPEAAHWDYAAILATTGYFPVAAEETRMLPANLQTMAGRPRDLGKLPMTVLSRGRVDGPPGATADDLSALERAWGAMQSDIATLSVDARHIVADGAGHYIQLDRPELVARAIEVMLSRA
jgi:pimeloyl-ACP methyl ester carboxylesterase